MTQVAEPTATLRRTGTAVLALAASELLGKAATLMTVLVMARILGIADFGLVSFGLSLGLLLAVLSSLGLDARLVQLGSMKPEQLDRCYGAVVSVRLALSAAILAGTAIVLDLTMATRDAEVISLLVASSLLDTITEASRAACAARQRQHLSALVLVIQRFSVLGLCTAALLLTGSVTCCAAAYLAGAAIGVACMHHAARRAGCRLQIRGSGPQRRVILRSAPITGAGEIAAMGVFRIDVALIGVMLGATAVGVYGAAYRVFESIVFVSWTLSRVYVPLIASRPDDPAHIRLWAQRGLLVACAIYLPYGVVIALRGDDLVALLFGPQYVHHGVLLALAAAPLLFGFAHLCASVLLALRPDPVVLVATVVALALNLAMNLTLIPRWGITAAAVSTTMAFLVESVVLAGVLWRITGNLLPPRSLAPIAAASGLAGAVLLSVDALGAALPLSGAGFVAGWTLATSVLEPHRLRQAMALLSSRLVREA